MHKNLRIFRFFEKWEFWDSFRHFCRNMNFLKIYYTMYHVTDTLAKNGIISPVGLAKFLLLTVEGFQITTDFQLRTINDSRWKTQAGTMI